MVYDVVVGAAGAPGYGWWNGGCYGIQELEVDRWTLSGSGAASLLRIVTLLDGALPVDPIWMEEWDV